ncbi:MAG: G8 domain-containing protein [Cyanobacteria bacterium P01_F01_bin.150]
MQTMNHSQAAHAAHPNDSVKQREHMQILDLVPLNKVTHRAIKSGNWSNPSTWENGVIPPVKADVLISDGVKVTYDVQSNARLDTIRVDGEIDFSTNKSTKLVIDTFVISPTGSLTIGTENKPIADNVKTEILFADNGKIDIAKDPSQLGRGLISHGIVRIHGEEKTTFLKVATDPMAGDRTLTLEKIPENWEVGDQLVLTGTHYQDEVWNSSKRKLEYGGSQDEEVKITGINGNKVTLDRALKYDHDTPKSELKAYVTNFTRNIVFANENPNAPIQERGHVMFMHSDDVDVQYAEFNQLGRTDKSKPLDDFKVDGRGFLIKDSDGNPIPADPRTVDNHRARYPFHFHRTGTEASSKAAIAKGNAVWGSPGLGYVHHESHAIFEDNAAYNTFGAAFVSESGNETGAWIDNIAIKSQGTGSLKEATRFTHDVGAPGVGFWFQGRIVENKGNISANQREAGFLYSLRGILRKNPTADNLDLSQIAKGATEIKPDIPNIKGFEDNEVFGSKTGLAVIKGNPKQEHDVRSVLDGFKAWEIGVDGAELQYTGKYTFKDWLVIQSNSKLRRSDSTGIKFSTSAIDMVVNGAQIEGFQTGIEQRKEINTLPNDGGKVLDIGDFNFDYVDVKFANIRGEEITNFDPKEDSRINSNQLKKGRLQLDISSKSDLTINGSYEDIVIYGTKVDSLGSTPHESRLAEGGRQQGSVYHWDHPKSSIYNLIKERGGYYTKSNGSKYFVLEELISDRATGEIKLIPVEVELKVPLSKLPSNAKNLGTYKLRDISVGSGPKPAAKPSHDHHGPMPKPAPEPMPAPDPEPVLAPDPVPSPAPEPISQPDPISAPAPEPVPAPKPALPSTPSPKPSPANLPNNGQVIRVEAETMDLQTYGIERRSVASDNQLISLFKQNGKQGTATTKFTGATGTYDIDIATFDENDGKATLSLDTGNKTYSVILDKSLGHNAVSSKNKVTHTIKDISLVNGQTVKLEGVVDASEFARVDYLEFRPVKDTNTPVSAPSKPVSQPAPAQPAPAQPPAMSPDPVPSQQPVPSAPTGPVNDALSISSLPPSPTTIDSLGFSKLENHSPSTSPEVKMWGVGGKKSVVLMKGAGWRRLPGEYNITPDTVLEVEFKSYTKGGVQGIGFDTDKIASDSDRVHTFRFGGTEQNWGHAVTANDITGSGKQVYRIPVGQYFTGDYDYLTLLNTQASGTNTKPASSFREVKLYEVPGIGDNTNLQNSPFIDSQFANGNDNILASATTPFGTSNSLI